MLAPSHNTKLVGVLTFGFALGYLFSKANQRRPESTIIPSPLKTLLPKLSASEASKLAYLPDALPGSRDTESPLGSLRIYEWGPEDGGKVLMVHGISTPSIALGRNLTSFGTAKLPKQ